MVSMIAAFERHQHVVLQHLPVVRNIVQYPDHAEHQPVAVENFAPFGEVLGGKNLVENLDQLQRSGVAVGLGGKTRIGDKILAADAAGQRRPLPFLVEQRQDEPAAVAASVMVGDGVQRAFARPPLLEFRAA